MTTELRFRGSGANPRFSEWLAKLKRTGSNILLTGEVPDAVSARASRSLFGREDRRFRVLGLTDQTIRNAATRLPDDASFDDPTTWIIDQRRGERSVPATAQGFTPDSDSLRTDDARQLCDEIQTAISFYDERADGLDPAELRVGVDSLFPLVQEDRAATRHVLGTLCATVRSVHGMAHYHLRVPDDEIVDDLMGLFDARVELRRRPRRNPEQRWYAPEIDAKTPWMEL
ncbi:hypothetical protein M0R89_01460 [Halorussus limi]|uniref:Uncharacterized protein n=1 Tax=Halorussus limi TaxID=2938695 RepID=A0A8U0HVJ1_9EURY|nr:hypothetical protein [Halorussus limi]UPV74753.1 hypothetical protein M0R89_01460 [Halorussus limi]